MLWTIPVPSSAVSVHFGSGRARYAMRRLRTPDYFNIPNAFFRFQDPLSQSSEVTFDVRFDSPITERFKVRNADVGYEGTFLLNHATMAWSARTRDGWHFTSDPWPTTSAFSMLGRERNGRFFVG